MTPRGAGRAAGSVVVMTPPRPPMMIVSEIAAVLRCSENEVRRLIHVGAWTAVKSGKQWLTDPRELDSYIASLPRNR